MLFAYLLMLIITKSETKAAEIAPFQQMLMIGNRSNIYLPFSYYLFAIKLLVCRFIEMV